MSKLTITRGEWVGVDYAGHYSLQVAPFYGERDLLDDDRTHEAEANMTLCCDAGNTYQSCGLLPSELLGKTEQLKEALFDMVNQFAYHGTKDGVKVIHTGGMSALEDAFDVLGLPDPCKEEEFESAIKNTEK